MWNENQNHWALRVCTGVALAVASLSAPGCDSTPGERQSVAQTSQALTSYTITLPSGTVLGQVALLAQGRLAIEDRVRVVGADGVPADVANAGTTQTNLGVEVAVGDVVSVASTNLRDRAVVAGDLTSGGGIQLGVGATVTGATLANQGGLLPGDQETLEIEFGGTSQGNVSLEPPNSGERVTDLAPGRYGQLVVKSRNRVNLRSGQYVLDSLQLEPEARFVVDDAGGPVLISVRDQLLYKGKIESQSGQHPALRLAYVGSASVVLESAFNGTLIAPSAEVRLGTALAPHRHVGSFFAKDLVVSPDVVVEFRPYFVYEATRDFEVSASTYGKFGYAAVTPDGSINARVHDNVVKVQRDGTHQTLLATGIEVQFLVDPQTGAFGYYGDNTFERYRPDGTLLASYPTSRMTKAWFIPGTEKTALLQSDDKDHEPEWSAIRLVGPSLSRDISAPGLRQFAVSPSLLVYATASELVAVEHSGSVAWRTNLALRDMVVASGGSALLGVRAQKGSSQLVRVNLANGSATDLASLDSALWSMALSPNGKYGVAATQTKLSVFKEGALQRQFTLPVSYFATADVNDAGEVVVGGATAEHTVLMIAGPAGTQAWVDATGARDNIAMRPYVRFHQGSADFLAVRKEGLARYTVKRSL